MGNRYSDESDTDNTSTSFISVVLDPSISLVVLHPPISLVVLYPPTPADMINHGLNRASGTPGEAATPVERGLPFPLGPTEPLSGSGRASPAVDRSELSQNLGEQELAGLRRQDTTSPAQDVESRSVCSLQCIVGRCKTKLFVLLCQTLSNSFDQGGRYHTPEHFRMT